MQRFVLFLVIFLLISFPVASKAQNLYSTTTLRISICGNAIVDDGEECDVLGETGEYSQTILGRQCSTECFFGPYCGDGILQTIYDEECDDGNNEDGDFCSAVCKIEPSGSGGGGSSGGSSGGGGGTNTELGNTIINVVGKAYPSQTINFLLDTEDIGDVRSNSSGRFEFTTEASPGTATLGIWAKDKDGNRSITLNNTFDVTKGAITNLNGVILPPTIVVKNQNVNPGEIITVSGQSVPDSKVDFYIDDSENAYATIDAVSDGGWSYLFDTSEVTIAEHILRAKTVVGTPPLTTESGFSTSLQLFVGVEGEATLSSDLNRDGYVNLTDFSILIFWWGTNGGNSDPPADINQNGKVSLEDFSILLFNWTG